MILCEPSSEEVALASRTVPAERPPRLVTPAFLLIAVSTLAYFTAEGALLPTVPLFTKRALGGDEVAIGLAVGAFGITALLSRPFVGRMADRRGRRPVMLIGMALFGVSVVGYLVASTVPLLIVMRLVSGLGAAFFFVGAATAVTDLAPEERRGEAVSFFSLALYAGVGIGPLLGEAAIGGRGFEVADYVLPWLLVVGLSIAAFLVALPVPDTRPEGTEAGPLRLVHRAAVVPGVVALTSIWGMAGFFAFTPLYAREIGLADSRFVFLLYSGVVLLIRGFGAKIPDRLGAGRAARAALSISAVGLVTIAAFEGTAGLLVGTVVLAAGAALAFPALMALTVSSAPPSQRGAAVGTFTAFVDLAFSVGPMSLGVVADLAGLRAVYLAAAGVALAGLGVLLVRSQRRRRRPAPPPEPVPEIPA